MPPAEPAEGRRQPGPTGQSEGAVPLVVVPHTPGPLVRPDTTGPGGTRRRDRDDLDELIDELFPDTDEPPGGFDAAVLVAGAALVGWAVAADGPTWALVVGIGCVALGLVLPLRWLWRRAVASRAGRRRSAVLARGVPLRTDDPDTARLVRAYDDLLALAASPGVPAPVDAAAHGALLEVATLLDGRPVGSPAERTYVTTRTAAIEDLVAALRLPPSGAVGRGPRPPMTRAPPRPNWWPRPASSWTPWPRATPSTA